jgi:hypothetical protein
VIGGWRKLHSEELHDFYTFPSIIRINESRRMKSAGHVAQMGSKKSAYSVLVRIPEGKRPLGIPNHVWEDNIKLDLREIGCGDIDWISLAQDRNQWKDLVNMVKDLRVP